MSRDTGLTWTAASGLEHTSKISFHSSTPQEVYLIYPNLLCAIKASMLSTLQHCPAVSSQIDEHWLICQHNPHHSQFCPLSTLFSSFFKPKYIRIQPDGRGMPNRQVSPATAISILCTHRRRGFPFLYLGEGRHNVSDFWKLGGVDLGDRP